MLKGEFLFEVYGFLCFLDAGNGRKLSCCRSNDLES